MNSKIKIAGCTVTSALGRGLDDHYQALLEQRSGLRLCDFPGVDLDTWIGRVDGLEDELIEGELAEFDCRNNRLAKIALNQDGFVEAVTAAADKFGKHRVGVFLGTSTSGVQQTELAYLRKNEQGELPEDYHYSGTQSFFSAADFTRQYLGLSGPSLAVSTACSSSVKVFATAYRHIRAGLCDAAIVGGVDSLCRMTMYGFNSLQLVSTQPCRPADKDRDGINIGEAAGFALLERTDDEEGIAMLGYGESSDAYHMSTPHPEGEGAYLSMQQALSMADLKPEQIDYINLHGTATPANDLSEDKATYRLFNGQVACSSTKGFTGHTLGAAGILEIVFGYIAITRGLIPASLNTKNLDPGIRSPIVMEPVKATVNRIMSNSFGFGGNNASLVIGRMQPEGEV